MLIDRRRHPRQRINRLAKVQAETGGLPRDCLITDISAEGARLHVEGIDVPDQFLLWITGERDVRRECRVVWRLGHEVGVTFVGPELRTSLQRVGAATA
jgi:hypothetical protein